MSAKFEQISLKPGFMKHNGGLLFKTLSEKEYQFKTKINKSVFQSGFKILRIYEISKFKRVTP